MKRLIIVGILALLCGCAGRGQRNAKESQFSFSIALLPFHNESNEVEAADKVRGALYQEMSRRGFQLMDLEKTDLSLKELGITEGGQLHLVTLDQIRNKIAADIFCYGTVIDYGFRSAVALSQRKVQIHLKWISGRSGKVLFEGAETGIQSRAGSEAAGDLALYAAGKVIQSVKDGMKNIISGDSKKTADLSDGIADVDLTEETHEAIAKLLDRYPR